MDKIDKKMKIKSFFRLIYQSEFEDGNNLKDGQYIRLYKNNKTNTTEATFNKVLFFKNLDELVDYCASNTINFNTYFTLSTVKNNTDGTAENLANRTVLGFDFDKKDNPDLAVRDIMFKFKELNLWYHAIVDSGNGYHVYICIESTEDIEKVIKVQKAIAERVGADLNALKTTQILRVPLTFNIKDKPKQVNIVHIYPKETIKRYNIDNLYKRFVFTAKEEEADRATTFVLNTSNIPPCIVKTLQSGSPDGQKNADLIKIVVTLRRLNKSLADIKYAAKEWNNKNEIPYSVNELKYQVEYIFNNVTSCSYNCGECFLRAECFSRVLSDFCYKKDEKIIELKEGHTKYLKKGSRKGVRTMEGRDLLVYCVLKNHEDGLYREEIEKELTYTKKKVVKNVALSKNTLTKALTSLEKNDFIDVVKKERGKKLYKLKEIDSLVGLTYNISFAATYECIKGNISPEELRLYNYMRYLHNKEQRENLKALKGNLLQINQINLAKDLGVTQPRISEMIGNLEDEKILSIWYRQPSKNNGFDYNIYKLNY